MTQKRQRGSRRKLKPFPVFVPRVAVIDPVIADIRQQLRAIRQDLAHIGRVVSKLPTTFQWVFIQTVLIIVIFVSVFGLWELIGLH